MDEALVEFEEFGDAVGFGHFQIEAAGHHDGTIVRAERGKEVGRVKREGVFRLTEWSRCGQLSVSEECRKPESGNHP